MYLFLDAAAATESSFTQVLVSLLPFALVIAIMYFMLIVPQKKKDKTMTEMRNGLEIGDGVVTVGGIVGRIVSIKEDTVVVETASSKIRFKRSAISDVEKLDAE